MNAHLYQYCERGHSAMFWAEPLNALSNGAFLIAGIAALYLLRAHKSVQSRPYLVFLSMMPLVIGTGSFLFHSFATPWAELADTIPITTFIFAYLMFALRKFLRLKWPAIVVTMIAFAAVSFAARSFECPSLFPRAPDAIGSGRCLWGSIAYAPALTALLLIAWVLQRRSEPAAPSILYAASVFIVSLTARTLDIPACHFLAVGGRPLGTHFVWHMLNACTLYLLLRAAINTCAVDPTSEAERTASPGRAGYY
jgi:ceramidase